MFDEYMTYASEKGRAAGTLKGHEMNFRNHILRFYGYSDMVSVTHEEHQAFLNQLRCQGVSPATRNRIRALLRVMYSVAIKNRLFGSAFKLNPFDSIGPAEEPKKTIQYLSYEMTEKLLESNKDTHYYPLILLMLKTGLRLGEALGIHNEQIDRSTGMLTIDRQFDKSQGKIVMRTKGRRIRVVYLIDEVLEALPTINEGPIFKKEDGGKLYPHNFQKTVLPRACKKAGIKPIHAHGLRHSFSANYLMSGGSIWDLSKILGHYSVNITEEYYAHFSLDHIRNRMRIIERKDNVVRAAFG